MSSTVPIPQGLSIKDWADQAVFGLDSYGAFPRLENPAEWQGWAANFLLNGELSAQGLPNPYEYDDWQLWADNFCAVLS